MKDDLKPVRKIIPPPLLGPRAEPRAHDHPCKHCPSAHHPDDPESAEIKTWPHEERLKTAFPCGWNGRRYCKGYCDQMGLSDADLVRLQAMQDRGEVG
jgi:hypothetical protein